MRRRIGILVAILTLIALRGLAGAPVFAADVTTIAGTGTWGFSGDGGPAIAASLASPHGMAVAANGTVYVADSDNFRVRRIGTGGVIDTIAGTGAFGDDGDGGPATSASLSGLLSIALSPAGDILYISDIDNNRVRQVDLGTGVITNFAGLGLAGFGFGGDGGPATSALLAVPEGVAVDASGNVYIGDLFNCVVRKVAAITNIITTVAGMPGLCSPSGDGGDALAAQFSLPRRMALDPSGNLFVLDSGSRTVRRVDATTNIITTIAGGGSTTPGFGDATTMDIGAPSDLVLDATNTLYISTFNQVFKVDLGTGMLSVLAGTGVNGFSGDGGPAQDATFLDIGGVASRADEILIADSGNSRIRAVVPPAPPPDDLIVDLTTSQAFLDALNAVPGSILLINVDGRDLLVVPNVTSVGLNVTITGNDQLLVIDLNALQSAGGNITISGNLTLQTLDMTSLTTVGGSLTVTNNPALNAVLVSGVTSIGGDLTVVGTAATVIDLSSLTTVTGSLGVSGNTSATAINMGGLTSVGGSFTVTGNSSANPINMGGLTSVGGNVDVTGNTSATAINMGGLTSVGGSFTVTGNSSANPINMGGLTSVNGDLTVVDNGGAAVDLAAGAAVGGSVTIETTGTGAFPMGGTSVAGDLTLDATGYTDVSGTTPGGALDLTAANLEALMHLQIQAASFTTPVTFSITRVDPIALVPESGLDAAGSPATIDPIAAYQFTFAIPTLNRDAALSFDIDVAQLDAATQTALLDALTAGTATMVTKGDAVGSIFQAFPVCAGADVPTVDGCVRIETFDALGQPTSGTAAIVRFSNVVGHFSTWAVATVTTKLTPVLTWPTPTDITYPTPLSATQLNATANVAGSFAYTPGSGTVLNAGTGQPLSVTFTPTDTANYSTASLAVTITVLPASSTTTVTCPASVTYNGAAQTPCSASVTGAGGLSLTPTPTYANNVNAGTATASYTYAGDANHTGSSDSKTFTINKVDPTVTFTGAPAIAPSGTTFTVASTTNSSSGPVYTASGACTNTGALYTTSGTGTCTSTVTWAPDANYYGATRSQTMMVVIVDNTPPTTTAGPSPLPNSNGWNNTDVTVSLYATDNVGGTGVKEIEFMLTGAQSGSGVVSGNLASVTITAEGITTLTYFARDNAGNQETAQTLTVRIDKGVPELAARCAPPGSPLVVVGRDGESGVASVTLTDTVPLRHGEFKERRTYLIRDLAGNQLHADFGIKAEGHDMKIALLGLTYNGTTAPDPPENELKCEWALEKRTDALKELEQKLTIEDRTESSPEHDETEIQAKFRAKKNETEIRVKTSTSDQKVTRPGPVFLHLTTDQGEAGFAY